MSVFDRLTPRWQTLLLFVFLCTLYVPFAGHYGLWDPWETHYGEVARQMVERNDWISLWWPGSPQDNATFWSKPVLTFWLMGLSMKIFGIGGADPARAAEMTQGWTAEWALRMPFLLLGILGVWGVWHLVRRVVGPRAALLSSLVLATSTQWALITRQAMTDMAFVTPMTVGLVYAGLALLLPEASDPLPRRSRTFFRFTLSWPDAPAFYVFVSIYVLCVLPQLVWNSVHIGPWTIQLGSHGYRTFGVFAVLPFWALFILSLWWMARARDRRAIYLWVVYLTGGIATLAKGPAGIAYPLIIVSLYLLLSGRLGEFLGPRRQSPHPFEAYLPGPLRRLAWYDGGAELLRGTLVFLCVTAPWYTAMLVRHGAPFWMEFIGDNYVNRAQGRHGDRGTFEYYLRQLGAGMFPWSGVAAAALLCAGRWLRERTDTPRRQLVLLCVVWFVVHYVVVSLVNTKFHHYILPALPALAILAGLLLDEIGTHLRRDTALALGLIGAPITWLSGRDMANFPARIGWLFNYDYVNAPGGGRPWPLVSIYGQRYEYGAAVMIYAGLALCATTLLCAAARTAPTPLEAEEAPAPRRLLALLCGFLLLFVAAMAVAPSNDLVAQFSTSKLPADAQLSFRLRWGYLLPAVAAALVLLRLLWPRGQKGWATFALGGLAIAWNCWVLDRFLIDISPHWSQKHVFTTYYRLRHGPQDPVVAWYMYWRGENLYTKNQIYDHRLPQTEKTVFLGDKHAEKLQTYLNAHRGKRIFFLLERSRLETLRGLLPEGTRQSLQVVDETNNKVYLAVAQL